MNIIRGRKGLWIGFKGGFPYRGVSLGDLLGKMGVE